MELKVEKGVHALGPNGLPLQVTGLAELLQHACMAISLRRGEFPYDREIGSRLWLWDPAGEHALERAVALANEALLDLPGVRAKSAEKTDGGVKFTIHTPLGEGEVTVWRATQTS